MPSSSKLKFWLLILCLIASAAGLNGAGAFTGKVSRAGQQTPTSQELEGNLQQAETPSDAQEEPEEELAPAAVQLDVSKDSPLIQELYRATRETKEDAILVRLAAAKAMVDGGANLKAVDPQGRTALHWAVFGSSYNTKPKVIVACEQIADAMIERGVEINREDIYNDTALDYLLYSPNFEMQTLLIEHGAPAVDSSSPCSGVAPTSHAARAPKQNK